MKTHSYTIIHYGADYLSYALRSVYDVVDHLHVIYTPHPTHGHRTDAEPPDTRQQLIDAAFAHDPTDKISWYDTKGTRHEGQQRDTAVEICKRAGADMVLVLDYDEVWHSDVLARSLEYVWEQDSARNWLINFTHLWRSFDWCCRDAMMPVRILDLRYWNDTKHIPKEFGPIYHFGYAVRDEVMQYKWRIHGHKGEMRPGWLDDQWAAWPPVADCHPTCDDTWTPEPFDKGLLPTVMRQHPFYELERIA